MNTSLSRILSRRASSLLRRVSALLAAAALTCALWLPALAAETVTLRPWCGVTFILTLGEEDPIFIDGTGAEQDLTGWPLVYMDDGRTRSLATAARQELTIRHSGRTYETYTSRLEPLTAAFRRLGFTPSPLESVLVSVSRGRIDVEVDSDLTYYVRDVEYTPYQTVRRPSAAIKKGEEDVVQVGSSGEKGGVYEVVWSNGAELSRQLVEELDSQPVDEIIEYGTASAQTIPSSVSVGRDADGGGTLTLSTGETLRFTRAISMTATAYTYGHGGVGSRTASGTRVRRGVAAVDRRVIPLGTKLFVVANGGIVYGEAVAEDTGVRGNRIDLYYDTYQQCINFGRRDCVVYILE